MVRLLPLLAACLILSGCFVFDEIDAGKAMMDKHSGNSAKKADAAAVKAKDGQPPKPSGAAWWATAKSLDTAPAENAAPDDPNTPIRCGIHGATRFMRRGDCLSQGGRPTS